MKNNLNILVLQKALREERRISLRTVAKETGLSYNTVLAFARDRLTEYPKATLIALCHYFQCNIEDLLTITEGSHTHAA